MAANPATVLPWQITLVEQAFALREAGQLPHAVLLQVSDRGDASALIHYLSQLLLCLTPQENKPCGNCENCRLLRAGTCSDFSMVTLDVDEKTKKTSKNIKIEQIRDLIYELNLTRQHGALKIAAVYPAERMNAASANALLKTLEEPAAGVLLLLVTHNPGRIPVTVRSRCQHWSIPLPARSEADAWLVEQGIESASAETYLDYALGDPVLAADLAERRFADLVQDFKRDFAQYLRGEQAVAELAGKLLSTDMDLVRRLLDMTLRAYCRQTCGAGSEVQGAVDHARARALLDLYRQAGPQLATDENNLDFQLQLEDVLISVKQILTRRPN